MEDMHEATFSWPGVDASTVIVTGTFDQWSSSVHLAKTPRGFEGKVNLPWGERVLYKFIVDGRWVAAQSQPHEPDDSGNVNNVYQCPSKPISSTESAPPLEIVESEHDESEAPPPVFAPLASLTDHNTVAEKTSQAVQQTKDTVAHITNDVLPESVGSALNQANTAIAMPILGAVQNVTGISEDVNETVPPANADLTQNESEAAKVTTDETQPVIPAVAELPIESDQDSAPDHEKGTEGSVGAVSEARTKGSGALAFVASNLGTAIHAFTGVDPLNQDKIPIATPTPTHNTFETGPQEEQGDVDTDPKLAASSDAGVVPVENIVPSTTFIHIPNETTNPVEIESVLHVESAAAEADVAPSTLDVPQYDAPSEANSTSAEPVQEGLSDALTHNIEPEMMAGEVSAVTESAPVPPAVDDTAIPATKIDAPRADAIEGIGLVAVAVGVPASEPKMATTEPETSDSNGTTKVEPVIVESVPRPEIVEAETTIAENDKPSTTAVPKEVAAAAAVDNAPVETRIAPSAAEAKPPTEIATGMDNKAAATVPISAATARVTSDKPDVVSSGAVTATTNTNDAKKRDASSPEKPFNGHSDTAAAFKATKTAASDTTGSQAFPATSPAPDTAATPKHGRKKRTSFFGKVKHLFSSDKEEKK